MELYSARSGKNEGVAGVPLAVHRNLIAIRRSDLEIDGAEIVIIEICQKSKDSVLFGVCYRPTKIRTSSIRQCDRKKKARLPIGF